MRVIGRPRSLMFVAAVLVPILASAEPPPSAPLEPGPRPRPTLKAPPPPTMKQPPPKQGPIRTLRTYTLRIDSIERSSAPPSTVWSLPGPDVFYDSAEVVVHFTLSNASNAPMTGRVTANFGGLRYPSAFAVASLAPRAQLQGTVAIGDPPSAGSQPVKLYWQTAIAATPALPRGGWTTTLTDSQTISVLGTPRWQPRAPYDLVYDGTDPNNFPLNARFAKQDKYFYDTGSRDLWLQPARPRIYDDCFNVADKQNGISEDNDYNGFRNGYCKHSPGTSSFSSLYCGNDTHAPYQAAGAINCASWSWKDEPFLGKCVTSPFLYYYHSEGHMNFTVATYEGIARWDNAQPENFFDSDWCIDLFTPHGAGVASEDVGYEWIHTEVDPHDVGDGFDRGFWKTYRDAIHDGQHQDASLRYSQATVDDQNRRVAPLVNGHKAIMIGLLGLDMGHDDAGSELHPVFGMAIHTGGRQLAGSGCDWSSGHCETNLAVYHHPENDLAFDTPQHLSDDTWALWAANYGNEGYCSSRTQHALDGNDSIIGQHDFPTLSFRLPWARDEYGLAMADVEVLDATSFALHAAKNTGRTDALYDVAIDRGNSITVTFYMWPADVQPYWFGELHLRWKPAPGARTMVLPPVALAPGKLPALKAKIEDNPTTSKMTDAQKKVYFAALKRAPRPPPRLVASSLIGTRRTTAAPVPPPHPLLKAHVGGIPAVRATTGDNAITRRALCLAHGGKVPNAPATLCTP
jgi:hypothetical protein